MESYLEFAAGNITWPYGVSGTVMVALAAASTTAYLFRGRFERILALVALAAAASLVLLKMDSAVVTVLLLASSIMLAFRDVSLVRRRLTSMGGQLGSTADAVRSLEIAEERRQMAVSRQPLSSSDSVAKRSKER